MAGRVQFVPIAHRFELLMEQRPEAFTFIGEPWMPEDPRTPGQLTEELEQRLTELLDTLRCTIMRNDLQSFTRILAGRASVNVRYDRFRVLREGA